MKKKNVLHFCNVFEPYISGTTTRIKNECLGLENIIVTDMKENGLKIPNKEKRDSFYIHRLSSKNIPILKSYNYYFKKYKEYVNYAIKNINDKEVDIVFGHNPYEYAKASFYYSKKKKKKYIYEVHGCMYDSSNKYIRKFINKRLEKKVLKNSEAIIVQTNSMKERIAKLYKIDNEKIHVIYNGINDNMYEKVDLEQVKRKKEELKIDKKIVLGYFGYLDCVNGVDRILNAANKIKREDVIFILAGDGPLKKDILNAQKENNNIKFLGNINNEDIASYYKMLDLFLLPRPSTKATETLLPMKLLEVVLGEIPILASDVSGIKDNVNINTIKFFDKNSEEKFLENILAFIENNDVIFDKESLYQNSLKVKSNFNWKTSREKLSKIISEIKYE